MTGVNVKLATLALAMAVLAGCGGESDAGDKPTATPTPRTYTLDEMAAALPTPDEIDGGLSNLFACPEDKDRCPGDTKTASVTINLEASSPELTERQADAGINVVQLKVRLDSDEASAKSEQAKRRKDDEKYDGPYDIARKDLGEGRYIPGERGSGAFGGAASGPFSGFRLDRDLTDEPRGKVYSTNVDVRDAKASVMVHVFLGAEGRKNTDARKVADKVLAEYLKRLG